MKPCTGNHPLPDCFMLSESEMCIGCSEELQSITQSNLLDMARVPLLEATEKERV